MLMDEEEPLAEIDEHQNQAEVVEPETSDVDFKHVRGLMYALVTICVFCASILLGPDEQILPADGQLKIPIVELTISQGSFLYFGPLIIICVSMYTYLFLLKILARVKAGRESSDQYIFTMQNPAAQVATYCIFFWLPTLVLFAFAYKALPRPESANLLGVALIFLIAIVSIQLLLRIYKLYFLNIIGLSIFLVLIGFVGNSGWLEKVRLELNTWRPMALEKAKLEKKDLRYVEIRNAKAESIILNGSDLRFAVIKNAFLPQAKLVRADLRYAKIDCTVLKHAHFQHADLRNTQLRITNFKGAKFSHARLRHANFHAAEAGVSCSKKRLSQTTLHNANLEEADLSHANLSQVTLIRTKLNGATLLDTKIIDATMTEANFTEKVYVKTKLTKKTNLTRADLRCSRLTKVKMDGAVLNNAELGGTDFTNADLANVDLSGANFDGLYCSSSCIEIYINNKKCSGRDIRANQKGCECDKSNAEDNTATQLVETNFQFANLKSSSLKGANLTRADLRGANLHGANLSAATLEKTNLLLAKLIDTEIECDQLTTAKYWKASIHDKDLECAQEFLSFEEFVGNPVKVGRQALNDLHSALEEFARSSRKKSLNWIERKTHNKTYNRMEGAMMSGVNLKRDKPKKLNLEGLYLNKAKLVRARLSGTILKEAKLKEADLEGAVLVGANLRGADLSRANMKGAILHDADLEGAILGGAILNAVRGLTCKQLTLATNWENSYRDKELGCKGSFPSELKPGSKFSQ